MELLKVKIVKADIERWYYDQIGSIFNVVVSSFSDKFYLQNKGYIYKSDCEIIQEEKQEPQYRQIPFDWEKYKSGMKAVCRDGTEPLRIEYFPERKFTKRNVLAISIEGGDYWHYNDGIVIKNCENDKDLFLLEEIKQKEGWINIYRHDTGCDIFTEVRAYNNRERALMSRSTCKTVKYIGDPIKITYYDTE